MQGKIVYCLQDERGEVLTWFGRDPEWEPKHSAWKSGGMQGREPEKFHFVKGYHRGLELYGQHVIAGLSEEARERTRKIGLLVVEGPNDVIAMNRLGETAFGLCSNMVTADQVAKLVRLATDLRCRLTLLLDCDEEGDAGARKAAYELAQHCDVRVAWSSTSHDGRFRGRQPESLASEN